MGLWTPSQITPARWFDFSDASSVTEVSGAVSQINDLSGNGDHLSQGTALNRPAYTLAQQNGLNVATFDGSNDFLSLASDFSLGTAHSIFVIAKNSATITNTTTAQVLIQGGSYTAPSTITSNFAIGAGSYTGSLTNERLISVVLAHNNQVWGRGKTNANVSGGFILSSAYTTSGNAFFGRLNGTNDLATSTSNGSFSSTNTRYPTVLRLVGSNPGGADAWNGEIWEVIVFASYLSQSDTELIEGYAAWKWGINSSLPVGHPYYTAAPATGIARRRINDGLFNRGLFNAGLVR